jgi:hypothetical protein
LLASTRGEVGGQALAFSQPDSSLADVVEERLVDRHVATLRVVTEEQRIAHDRRIKTLRHEISLCREKEREREREREKKKSET